MPIIEKKLLPIGEILKKELVIPEYQRPYKWKEETILKLLNDIKNNKNKNEYRIGTLILHKTIESEKEIYNIVDGQQRLVSISIIINVLNKINPKIIQNTLLNSKFSEISKNNIVINYKSIKNYINNEEDKRLFDFFLNNCKMVVIVVNNLEEAFQLFDSQNSRGKSLEAFDLLKAYHLNEVSPYINSSTKKQIVNKWERLINNNRLGELFNILYRIKKWTVRDDASDNFYKDEINLFKGINKNKNYPYIDNSIVNNYYDINMPIINGEYFFYIVEYYNDLYDSIIEDTLKNASHINYHNSGRRGDILVKSLYKSALIAFINKFGINNLNNNLNIKIYAYAYRIRLEKYAVSNSVINNSINNYFYYIYNFCYEPNDILKLDIMNKKIEVHEKRKIDEIIDYIKNTLPVFYKDEEIK